MEILTAVPVGHGHDPHLQRILNCKCQWKVEKTVDKYTDGQAAVPGQSRFIPQIQPPLGSDGGLVSPPRRAAAGLRRQHETPLPTRGPPPNCIQPRRRPPRALAWKEGGSACTVVCPSILPPPPTTGRAVCCLHVAILLQWCGQPRACQCARSWHAAGAGSHAAGAWDACRSSSRYRPRLDREQEL